MSWHYSQEQEAGFSLHTYLDGIRSQRSKSKSTREKSCCNGNATGCSTTSQSGMMSAPSTVAPGVDSLMLFRGDFPAKTLVLRVEAMDLPEPVRGFGSSICASLRKYGLALSSPKTHRTCVPTDSAPSSKDLPAWGMAHDGVCWELGTSARRTSETECGYLPTPQASDHITKRTSKSWKAKGRVNFCLSNPEIQGMWPTPRKQYFATPTATANQLSPSMMKHLGCRAWWPTPTAHNAKECAAPSEYYRNTPTLAAQTGGKLNPPWVEWLMGWPIGWTDSKPLATDKFQQWRKQHSAFFQEAQYEPALPHHNRHAR